MQLFFQTMPSTKSVLQNLAQLNFLLIILCLLPIILAPFIYIVLLFTPVQFRPDFPPLKESTFYYIYIALLSITSLLSFLLIGSDSILDPNVDNGPTIRTSLAGAVVVTYFAIMVSLLNAPSISKEAITVFENLGTLVTWVIGFYFGSTTINSVSAMLTGSSRKETIKSPSFKTDATQAE